MDLDFYCGACGALFGPDDIPQEQWDDMHCPECGSQDLGGTDDLEDDPDQEGLF